LAVIRVKACSKDEQEKLKVKEIASSIFTGLLCWPFTLGFLCQLILGLDAAILVGLLLDPEVKVTSSLGQ